MMKKRFVYICLLICCALYALPNINAQTPVLSFLAANGGSLGEGIGGVNTSVTIMNPNANETTVEVLQMGTAISGVDYTINPDTIVFPAGSSNSQPLTITLIADCIDESNETIILMLANPSNGAQLNISTITFSLSDDDTDPVEDCTYTVPSNTGVVTNTFSYFSHNGIFWVCESGILRLRSNNSIALVESGGTVRAERDRNVIFVKSGGTVIVDDGDQNVIYAEDGAIVTVESGICNYVFASSGAVYTDNGTGTNTEELTCAPLAIDYTSAPMPGCIITSAHNMELHTEIEIFPNPTSGSFEIRHAVDHVLQYLEVYDSQGVFMMRVLPEEKKLPLIPGVYLLRCVFDDFVVIKRLVKSSD